MDSPSQHIKSFLDQWLDKGDRKVRQQENQAILIWKELVGAEVLPYVQHVRAKNKTLFIKLSMASLRTELHYRQSDYVREINEKLGAVIIERIIFV